MLLSFAQFAREVTGERIRDKTAASKRKGIWMGGLVLGYDVRERQLVINETEAATVRKIFARHLELGSVRLLQEELDRDSVRSKRRVAMSGNESGGQSFSRGALYTLLSNQSPGAGAAVDFRSSSGLSCLSCSSRRFPVHRYCRHGTGCVSRIEQCVGVTRIWPKSSYRGPPERCRNSRRRVGTEEALPSLPLAMVRHKGSSYPGQHQPIVARPLWERAQELLQLHTVRGVGKPTGAMNSPLVGKLFDETGERLTPSHAVKGNTGATATTFRAA